MLFFVTFMMVIAYHVLYVFGVSNKLTQAYHKVENLFNRCFILHHKPTMCENTGLMSNSDSFNGSFADLREPALSL